MGPEGLKLQEPGVEAGRPVWGCCDLQAELVLAQEPVGSRGLETNFEF